MTLSAPWLLVVIVPLLYLWWRLGRGTRSVRALRVAMLLVAVMMLAGPSLLLRQPARSIVLLVDQSLPHQLGEGARHRLIGHSHATRQVLLFGQGVARGVDTHQYVGAETVVNPLPASGQVICRDGLRFPH